MKTVSICKLTFVTATAAAVVLGFCWMPFAVHAQSTDSNDTIQLITGGGKVTLQTAEGRSNSTCTTTSTDHAVAVAVDGRCSSFGTPADLPEHFYVKITGDKLTFRDGGKNYVVRDASVIDGTRALFAPVRDLMRRQYDLSQEMRDAEARERTAVPRYVPAKVSVPDLNADFQKVEADAKRLSAEGGTQSELSELQSELSELQSRISAAQSRASEAESQLSEQKSELSQEMSAMGEQTNTMSAQMSAWSKQGEEATVQAARDVKAFLDQAIANGIAKPE